LSLPIGSARSAFEAKADCSKQKKAAVQAAFSISWRNNLALALQLLRRTITGARFSKLRLSTGNISLFR
jgi:hypothetical protein